MKIIIKDNFDNEMRSDKLLCSNIDARHGKKIVDFLNKESGPDSLDYYVLVEDDHKLYEWKP